MIPLAIVENTNRPFIAIINVWLAIQFAPPATLPPSAPPVKVSMESHITSTLLHASLPVHLEIMAISPTSPAMDAQLAAKPASDQTPLIATTVTVLVIFYSTELLSAILPVPMDSIKIQPAQDACSVPAGVSPASPTQPTVKPVDFQF